MQIQRSFDDENQPCLYVCSTPIGNLQDVSLRLLTVLREADVIAAEDTRQTRKLLSYFEIHPKLLVSYHQHNEEARQHDLLEWWHKGWKVALVSDAGTPAFSDPGFDAVQLAVKEGIRAVPIPGPSALSSALVASGIVPQPFLFIGFLPRQERQRKALLEKYRDVTATVILYESPHRLLSTLTSLGDGYDGRPFVLARELTKKYESFIRGSLPEVIHYIQEHGARGEFVIVMGPPPDVQEDQANAEDTFAHALGVVQNRVESGMSHKEAVTVTAKEIGIKRRDLYQATLPDNGPKDT